MDGASVTRVIAAIDDHAAQGGAAIIATHEALGFAHARAITMAEAP
jgi:ABC-type transport system involved in cytochrome c biogenesis ATPase subunit